MEQKHNVIVVGGGLAGLTAAYYVSKDSRYEVTLLEARDRLGGRVHTTTVNGVPVDLGGFMIFAWYKHLKLLLRELGLNGIEKKYGSYTEYFQNKDGSFTKDNAIRMRHIFPPKLVLSLIIPLLKGRLNYYRPDLSLYMGVSAQKYFDEKLGKGHRSTEHARQLALGYTYGDLTEVPVSLYVGFGYKLLFHGGFKHCTSFENGTSVITEKLVEKIKQNGGRILLNSPVAHIDRQSVNLVNNEVLSANSIVLAHGVNDEIISNTVEQPPQSKTEHYAAVLTVKEIPPVNNDTNWTVIYCDPSDDNRPQLASIGNLRSLRPALEQNIIFLYLRMNPNDPLKYTDDQIRSVITEEMQKQLPGTEIEAVNELYHWEYTMPVVSGEFLKSVRQRQGDNGIYITGDFMGSPCMETAVYNGKNVAELLIKNTTR